jgi:hypothetical protein
MPWLLVVSSTEMSGNYFTMPQGGDMVERIPQKRLDAVGELSGPLLLLASNVSSYMAGSIIVADRGPLSTSL